MPVPPESIPEGLLMQLVEQFEARLQSRSAAIDTYINTIPLGISTNYIRLAATKELYEEQLCAI